MSEKQISIINNEKKGMLEAILFASGEAVQNKVLAEAVLMSPEDVDNILKEMQMDYQSENRGLRLICFNQKWQLSTKPKYLSAVSSVLKISQSGGLSKAAIETLAIIAYKQPVTRLVIEQIRGVSSTSSIQILLDRDLITEAGRLDVPGRPFLYKTTELFLKSINIGDLNELPDYEQFSKIETILEQE